jgi:SAM-dependent methyltransferase
MAAGYAWSRPAVHARVIELVWRALGRTEPFARALDIGCGAGLSTQALAKIARECIGIEPALSMLTLASQIVPAARFIAAGAEAIPLRDGSVDLLTAAGSLNYVDLGLFFPEAARVLRRDGMLVVYDFSAGRSFAGSSELDRWFDSFLERYPPPAHEARELNPQILAEIQPVFHVRQQQEFEIALTLSRAFYRDYVMTETNVAAAVRRGTPAEEIRRWCDGTLADFWEGGDREVLFLGYFACLNRVTD